MLVRMGRTVRLLSKAAPAGDWRAIKQKNQRSRSVALNDGSKLSFLTAYHGLLVFNRVKAVTLSETDYVRIECPNRESIDQIWQRAHAIRSLVGFGMRRAACVDDIVLFIPGGPRAILIFARSDSGDAHPTMTPLFTRPALSNKMTHYLRAWHDNFPKLEAVLALASAADYQSGTYYSLQFLSYAQAIETLHRRTRKGRFEDHDAYKPTLAVLKRAIPEDLQEDYRKRIESGLNHLNEWSLLQRLYDFYDLEARNIRRLFPERDRDMRLIRDVRNYLTHFEDRGRRMEKYIQDRSFVILTRKLRFFVEMCLLRSIGMSEATKSKLLAVVREYQWLATQSHRVA
jgi:hypothetical protein